MKRKAEKISKIQWTLSLVMFWTIIQTAIPKNNKVAKMTIMMRKSLVFHFINALQPVGGRKSKAYKA